MKKLSYTLILSGILSLILYSCQKLEETRIPETEKAANVRIQLDPKYSSLRADDIPNAKIVFSVYSENTNIDQVELIAEYYNFASDSLYSRRIIRTFKQSDFDAADGAIKNITITSKDLAKTFGLASLNEMGGGDRFDFYNITSLTNGLVFPDTILLNGNPVLNISPGVINTASTTSYTTGFTVYVACPFVANDAVGTYEVVRDDWADWNPGEQLDVVANADGTGIIIKGLYSKFRNDSRGPYDVEVLVDANTGIATVEQQPAWEYYWYAGTEGYGTGSVAGGGFVFSCSGIINLTLEHTVTAGTFGSYTIILQKI